MNLLDPLLGKAVLKALVLPPTGLLLIAGLGLALRSRHPRTGQSLAVAGIVALLALSIPATADFLTGFVDTSPVFEPAQASRAKAIVILGGGVRRHAAEYGGDTLAPLTLARVRYGARVARQTGLPVLVSGGPLLGSAPEAMLMKAALENEFGVPVRWAEVRSRTTHENAVLSAAILRGEGIARIVLVAHAFDMRRASAEFAAQGIEVIGAPTGKVSEAGFSMLDFVPSMGGLQQSYFATYEILANLVLWASDRRR